MRKFALNMMDARIGHVTERCPIVIGANRFELLGLIAHGGMCSVYRGVDCTNSRTVAIKCLAGSPLEDPDESEQRMAREATILRMLDHPNVIKMVLTFVENSRRYIVLEHMRQGSLRERLRRGNLLTCDEAIRLGLQLCSALAHMHDRGVIHRDIKPENVLLADDGTLRIVDFGISRLNGHTLSQQSQLRGTLAYVCPEILWDMEVDPRADVWALGVTLFELLTGNRPFDGSSAAQLLTAILHKKPLPLSFFRADVPPRLQELVVQMLEKEPRNRPDVGEVLGTLAANISESATLHA